jgi:hypothetical protein
MRSSAGTQLREKIHKMKKDSVKHFTYEWGRHNPTDGGESLHICSGQQRYKLFGVYMKRNSVSAMGRIQAFPHEAAMTLSVFHEKCLHALDDLRVNKDRLVPFSRLITAHVNYAYK